VFDVKNGKGEGWKDNYLGTERYFSYWSAKDIESATRAAGFSDIEMGQYKGQYGNHWITLIAKKAEEERWV